MNIRGYLVAAFALFVGGLIALAYTQLFPTEAVGIRTAQPGSPSVASPVAPPTVVSSGTEVGGSASTPETTLDDPTPTFTATTTPAPTYTATPPPTPTPGAPVKTGSQPEPSIPAPFSIAIDARSGSILYARNMHGRVAPASLTKIVTALVAIEHGDLDEWVAVEFDDEELYDSTLMGIRNGEWYTLRDLLYGLMLPSGNDSALAIANHISGSEEQFAELMNIKVGQLGLTDSHFVNPHGLDEADHYSSPYDMAMITRYALRNSFFAKLAATRTWDVNGTRGYTIYNLNRLLGNYPGADGVKVGYTEAAGPSIVASATRDGNQAIVAFMGGRDTAGESTRLFNYIFENFTWPDGTN